MVFLVPILFVFFICGKLGSVNIDLKSVAYVSPDPVISLLNEKSSYFGYSMALLRSQNSSWRLLVGAPKSNTSDHESLSPGVIHSCDLSQKNVSCKVSYHPNMDGGELGGEQMFGATMVSTGRDDQLIACGFKKMRESNRGHVCPGACTVFTGDVNTTFTAPGNDIEWVSNSEMAVGYYFARFAQMGFSLHKSPADDRIYFGMPGVMTWKGGVYTQSGAKYCTFHEQFPPDQGGQYEIFGYSVATLRTKERRRPLTVLASPKFAGHGNIFIVDVEDDCNRTNEKYSINGTCFECMFGSSLVSMDVDGDGDDELVVGSPLYNLSRGDEGAVFVYKKIKDAYRQVALLTGSESRGARFGTSLYSIGDANMDGYEDLIVGSPYEGRGVVYLYCGSNETFAGGFSQRIAASTLDHHLMRFGYSFQSLPLDGNSYGGVAVGAYLSDRVAILTLRPRHSISCEMTFHPAYVPWNPSNCLEFYNQTSKVNLTMVFKYFIPQKELAKFGSRFYRNTEVSYELVIDVLHRRGFLVDEALHKFDRERRTILFNGNKTTIVQNYVINFDIKGEPIYASKHVSFKLDVNVSKYDSEINPSFEIVYKKWSKIPFRAETESKLCRANVTFQIDVMRPLTVGSRSGAILSVDLRNHGDSTLHTEFIMDHGPFLRLAKITENSLKCNSSTTGLHRCEMNNFMLGDSSTLFEVHLTEIEGWEGNFAEVKFSPEGHGTEGRIGMFSWYRSEIAVIKSSNGSIGESTLDIRHFFDIRNNGPGLHRKISMKILVPIFSSICCMNNDLEVDFKTKYFGKTSPALHFSETVVNPDAEDFVIIEQSTINMTCGTVDCEVYSLELENMTNEETIDLKIRISINGSLSSRLKPFLINETKSKYNEVADDSHHRLDVTLKSVLVLPSGQKKTPWWLIVLCLVVGIVHLVLLVLLLKKCGFFRRKGREKLEEERGIMEEIKRAPQRQQDDLSGEETSQKTFL